MSERDTFTAAREITDPDARAAFLAESCGGDVAQRERLEGLLRADARPNSVLDVPACALANDHVALKLRRPPDTWAGLGDGNLTGRSISSLAPASRSDSLGWLGHYEVLEVLGKGGFGIVFRAFDEVLQRTVAIKVLAPLGVVAQPERRRFLNEARAVAAVRHPNVVQVYAVHEQPLPYIVMEFVPGETLQQRLDRDGPLDTAEVVRIGRQIAEGLACAHANGLIHRDIKPANVLLDAGAPGLVKLTDFGLACAADHPSAPASECIAGTPMYMSPEQARGERIDHLSDLFSLGSVLYFMTTGRPPFRAESSLAVLKRVCEDMPQPVPEIVPEVPAWLCDLIARLHSRSPSNRIASAREPADLLAQPRPELSATVPAIAPVQRRRRWPVVTAVLVSLLLAVGLAELTGVIELRNSLAGLFRSGSLLTTARETADVPGLASPKSGPDRAAATWALSSGGFAEVRIVALGQETTLRTWDGGKEVFDRSRSLPQAPFELVQLNVNRNRNVTDESLVVLRALRHLRQLQLTNIFMTNAALPYLKDSTKLERLLLYNTGVTDLGLPHLEGLTELRELSLRQTRVTEGGVRKLAAALPKCRILWNRGVLGPSQGQ